MSESDPAISRLAQQETWKRRLGKAESDYQHASEELRQAQLRNASGGAQSAVEAARQRKEEARREYLRVLRVFTDLVLRGKSPREGE